MDYPPRVVTRADPPPSEEDRAKRREVMRKAAEKTADHILVLRIMDALATKNS